MEEKKNKSLYNIELDYLNLMRDIELAEGEVTEEIAKQLEINSTNLEDKVKSYIYYMDKVAGDIAAIKVSMERLKARDVHKNNVFNKLKNSLLTAVELYGAEGNSGNKVLEFDTCKLFTKNLQSLEFKNEESFYNTDYMTFKITEPLTIINVNKAIAAIKKDKNHKVKYTSTINKKLLLNDLKKEVKVDGVGIVIKPSLTIK